MRCISRSCARCGGVRPGARLLTGAWNPLGQQLRRTPPWPGSCSQECRRCMYVRVAGRGVRRSRQPPRPLTRARQSLMKLSEALFHRNRWADSAAVIGTAFDILARVRGGGGGAALDLSCCPRPAANAPARQVTTGVARYLGALRGAGPPSTGGSHGLDDAGATALLVAGTLHHVRANNTPSPSCALLTGPACRLHTAWTAPWPATRAPHRCAPPR